MSYFMLKNVGGRPLSVFPFATLQGAHDYLQWHHPHDTILLTQDEPGKARFTVAGTTIVVGDYGELAAGVSQSAL